MKKCMKCGETKDRVEFYRHAKMADGLLSKCKTCTKRDVRENRARKIEYYREYDRARANLPHRVEARAAYAQTTEGMAAARRGSRAYVERNPVKRAAQVATGNAIRDGRLIREPCEVCGEVDALRKDAKRIRWLAANMRRVYGRREVGGYDLPGIATVESYREYCDPQHLREAIDAAMNGANP